MLAQRTLTQAQQAYASMTGNRGMQTLLSGTNRNYLPATWDQLNGAMNGSGGSYGALGSDVNATVTRNAVLTPAQVSSLSARLAKCTQSASSIHRTSGSRCREPHYRTRAIGSRRSKTLINTMPSATDQKGTLELHTRIGAEQGMLQNEQTKMGELYKSAEVATATARMRADEQAVADIGSCRP